MTLEMSRRNSFQLLKKPFQDLKKPADFIVQKCNKSVMEVHDLKNLPCIIMVTEGHYSEVDVETFAAGQIFRLSKVSQQRRLIARDIKGRYLTLPVNLPYKFRVVKGYKNVGPVQTLQDIITENTLPVSVQFAMSPNETFRLGSSPTNFYTFGNILLVEEYDEKYFLTNCIGTDFIIDKVIIMPLYLREIRVALIDGIENCSNYEWKEFQEGLGTALEHVQYDLTRGNPDIAILPEDCGLITSDNIYDYIDPSCFVDLNQKNKKSSKYDSLERVTTEPGSYGASKGSRKLSDPGYLDRPKLPHRPPTLQKLHSKSDSQPQRKTSREIDADEAFFSGEGIFKGKSDEVFSSDRVSDGSIGSLQFRDNFVSDFTIKDICEILPQLKMEKYTDALREAQIDGSCLLSLNEQALTEDFEMKKYEAAKLLLFARTGHVPK